jgi:tetratricopeptide (TPR) repeat protein
VKLLADILAQRPESVSAKSRLAAQHGLMAGILRDRGEAEEALRRYDEGLHLLEGLVVGADADPLARFRYALLNWEKGRMLGFSGKRDEEIAHQEKSLEILLSLLESSYGVSRGETIRRSIGYLLGDLGHAREAAGEKPAAEAAFGEAVKIWESLHRDRPASEEYEEALDWNRQRLAEFRPAE